MPNRWFDLFVQSEPTESNALHLLTSNTAETGLAVADQCSRIFSCLKSLEKFGFVLPTSERRIPSDRLLRRINPVVAQIMLGVREKLAPFYSEIGRPSIDPELLIRMLIVGYCYGIRSERQLCQEVELHLAYRWFCRLGLDDPVPDHSTFSVNRHGRFRASDTLRQVFEAVVRACMNTGLVKSEGFAADASVMEADASRYHGKAPDEIDWSHVQAYLAGRHGVSGGRGCRLAWPDLVSANFRCAEWFHADLWK